ncbi:FAD-dependent monooxygenase [Dactylosporangium sp. NBC_01737]|uniref:FAD-dependent monooxygenase n=1 Tax=Dactylosporangium sp. NBC_01737 TaxID=2975959 RepID=UPI002E11D204|nr:FAD-dependent monooxygenase [Dactylosporangium sp. NBC_01737]
MTPPTVLISGAGVAGPTLAHFMARHGFRPTIVERAGGQRSSGNPVDVRGPALPVAEELGIMPQLRAAATHATSMLVIDAKGRPAGRVPMPSSKSAAGNREVELPRGDLAAILQEAARDDAELLWDDTVTSVSQDGSGVDVMFEREAPRRFDLVIGADGLHSAVRRLVFGPERDFVRHMGVWVATMPLDGPAEYPHDVLMHNTPGRLVSIHPSTGRAMVAFIFRGPMVDGFDHRDTAQHKRIVTEAYADAGWCVPELLCRPGRMAGSRCSATRRPVCPCSATDPASPWPAPTPSPPLWPQARRTTRRPSGHTRQHTASTPTPSSAPPASPRRC